MFISKKLNYYIELSFSNTKSRQNGNLQCNKLHCTCNSNIFSQNTEKLSICYWLFGWGVQKGCEREKEGGEVNTLY